MVATCVSSRLIAVSLCAALPSLTSLTSSRPLNLQFAGHHHTARAASVHPHHDRSCCAHVPHQFGLTDNRLRVQPLPANRKRAIVTNHEIRRVEAGEVVEEMRALAQLHVH